MARDGQDTIHMTKQTQRIQCSAFSLHRLTPHIILSFHNLLIVSFRPSSFSSLQRNAIFLKIFSNGLISLQYVPTHFWPFTSNGCLFCPPGAGVLYNLGQRYWLTSQHCGKTLIFLSLNSIIVHILIQMYSLFSINCISSVRGQCKYAS